MAEEDNFKIDLSPYLVVLSVQPYAAFGQARDWAVNWDTPPQVTAEVNKVLPSTDGNENSESAVGIEGIGVSERDDLSQMNIFEMLEEFFLLW